MENTSKTTQGKKPNQKLKPYAVLQYLMKYSDENNVVSAETIVDYLRDDCGIQAERRSIYRDIEEINAVALMLEEDCTIDKARAMLEEDRSGMLKIVVYDGRQKGFYLRQRHFDLNDVRLLAECVYAAKFVNEGQARRLVDVVCDLVSMYQADTIRHNAFLVDRVKTNNKGVLNNIAVINAAMSRQLDGKAKKPEAIEFKYLRYNIDDLSQQVENGQIGAHHLEPYQLMINDGNYYLLGFETWSGHVRTYRVDRMKDVRRTGCPRRHDEEFRQMDIKTYAQRVFSMSSGKPACITLLCEMTLLDVMVERFGVKNAIFQKVDNEHFSVSTKVEVSEQFYGWLTGFGKKVMLTDDSKLENGWRVARLYKKYLDDISKMYD